MAAWPPPANAASSLTVNVASDCLLGEHHGGIARYALISSWSQSVL